MTDESNPSATPIATARTRLIPELPKTKSEFESFAERTNAVTVTPDTNSVRIEFTVPTRRINGVLANIEEENQAVKQRLTVHKAPSQTVLQIQANSFQEATGILDVLYVGIGLCRVCGDSECCKGIAYGPDGIHHKTEHPFADENPNEQFHPPRSTHSQ